jgi:hypothetical protein
MPAPSTLIERSGDLKGELVDFALQSRFSRALRQARRRRFGLALRVDEAEWANFLDWFILQERLPGGHTVVEHFVAEHPELPDEERALLLGWRDVVESIFEVKQREGEALVVVNLVDELTYRVRSNMGPAVFRQTPRRSFLGARLVPIADEWLLSGVLTVLPAESRVEVYRETSTFAAQHPELVFCNPEKLEQAWELQRQERRHFIDFFGADLVVLPGREVQERMRAYAEFRMHEVRDDAGTSAATHLQEKYGVASPRLDFLGPDDFGRAKTVGVICDGIEGLNFFVDFGQLEETFADPALAADRKHRQAVLEYLNDPSISPLPLRRLAARDPERASQVFQRVLQQPDFSWERDGEALLRRAKARYFERPPLPSVIPLGNPLARALTGAPDSGRTRPDYRPARRGKKKGRSR